MAPRRYIGMLDLHLSKKTRSWLRVFCVYQPLGCSCAGRGHTEKCADSRDRAVSTTDLLLWFLSPLLSSLPCKGRWACTKNAHSCRGNVAVVFTLPFVAFVAPLHRPMSARYAAPLQHCCMGMESRVGSESDRHWSCGVWEAGMLQLILPHLSAPPQFVR